MAPLIKDITAETDTLTAESLYQMLLAGETRQARLAILSAYIRGMQMAELFDGPIAGAMARIGELWRHEPAGIYREHISTGAVIEAVSQVHALFPPSRPDSPVAVGGTMISDPYLLPSLGAACVLREQGFYEVNLGPCTPPETFLTAIDVNKPVLLWLSVSSPASMEEVARYEKTLFPVAALAGIRVVIGGRLAGDYHWPAQTIVLRSMAELVDAVYDLKPVSKKRDVLA